MTKVYFIRHAETNYDNHNDLLRELTSKGTADRKLVTEYLSDKAVDTVSDFALTYGKQIEIIDDFRERKVDSVWIEDFHGFSKKQWEDFDYKLSDGETLHEVQDRNIKALMETLTRYCGKNIVVGSHGTALSTIINYFRRDFGFKDFEDIRTVMPWIVCFSFEGQQCIKIEAYDVFTKINREL